MLKKWKTVVEHLLMLCNFYQVYFPSLSLGADLCLDIMPPLLHLPFIF